MGAKAFSVKWKLLESEKDTQAIKGNLDYLFFICLIKNR